MVITFGPHFAKIVDCSSPERNILRDALSFQVEGFRFTSTYRKGLWDGYRRFLDKWGVFPSGFLPTAREALAKHGFELIAQPSFDKPLEIEPIFDVMGITLFDVQRDAMTAMLHYGRGLVKAPTGLGKTEIGIATINSVLNHRTERRRAVWFTHSISLAQQTRERFKRRVPGLRVGIVGDNHWELDGDVTVAMVQTVAKRLKEGNPRLSRHLSSMDVIIVDEAHLASADSFVMPVRACVDAKWIWGLTATPELRSDVENATVTGLIGPIIFDISPSVLISLGLLAEPMVRFIQYQAEPIDMDLSSRGRKKRNIDPEVVLEPGTWSLLYKRGITENEFRNDAVVRQAKCLARSGIKTLIMVSDIDHGNRIWVDLASRGIPCLFIWGDSDSQERSEAMSMLASGEIKVLIASTILDTGVDIPEIEAMILAGGGKSSVATYQRVGRGMRTRDGKLRVLVYDFVDKQHKRLLEHSRARFSSCNKMEGYRVSLANGVDSRPWGLLLQKSPQDGG